MKSKKIKALQGGFSTLFSTLCLTPCTCRITLCIITQYQWAGRFRSHCVQPKTLGGVTVYYETWEDTNGQSSSSAPTKIIFQACPLNQRSALAHVLPRGPHVDPLLVCGGLVTQLSNHSRKESLKPSANRLAMPWKKELLILEVDVQTP